MTENTAMIVAEGIATVLQRIDDWHSFSDLIILVTGAVGFIGNFIVGTAAQHPGSPPIHVKALNPGVPGLVGSQQTLAIKGGLG